MVLDSIGSSRMGGRPVRRLRSAGCQVHFYQSISLYRLHRLNNRTHRELLVVDGSVAFTGGAGVADWWAKAGSRGPVWRDTMTRFEGPIVTALQSVFAENWLEASGEILIGRRHWPRVHAMDATEAMVVKSSPSDRATMSRAAFGDRAIAERLLEDFEGDLAVSDEIREAEWRGRPVIEKLVEPVCWILERQQ